MVRTSRCTSSQVSIRVFFMNICLRSTSIWTSIALTRYSHCAPFCITKSQQFILKASKSSMTRGVLKENLPHKVCVACNRPFNWRKKWERCWDEVTTCSKSCNAKRREAAKSSRETILNGEELQVAVQKQATKEKASIDDIDQLKREAGEALKLAAEIDRLEMDMSHQSDKGIDQLKRELINL